MNTTLLPQLANATLETVLNYLIQTTPNSAKPLAKLHNQVLSITLTSSLLGQNITRFLCFGANHVDVLGEYAGDVDCALQLKPSALRELGDKRQLARLINERLVIVEGNVQVLEDFNALLAFLETDPAEILSRYLGDVPAQFLVNSVNSLRRNFQQKCDKSGAVWQQRLTDEMPIAAAPLAVANFCDDVNALASDVAKFEEKFQRWENKR